MTEYMDKNLKAPFPYFGGKGRIAETVWEYLGDVKQYIEPFFGSGAVLLKRPPTSRDKIYEIVCDLDCNIANVWRSIQFNPDEVAKWCDWPINHADLIARKKVLIENKQRLTDGLVSDPEFYDPKFAGYWVWAASCWIGSGMMRPNQIPHLTRDTGIHSQRPHLTYDQGIHSKRPHLARDQGIHSQNQIYQWMDALSKRLRYVKVVCGQWTRVCGGNWQDNNKPVGMFFDPPYATDFRDKEIYDCESLTIAKDVEKWVLARGDNKNYRIVVCGYEDEYKDLTDNGWSVKEWSADGGYSGKSTAGAANRHRERLFISPYCESMSKEGTLFGVRRNDCQEA